MLTMEIIPENNLLKKWPFLSQQSKQSFNICILCSQKMRPQNKQDKIPYMKFKVWKVCTMEPISLKLEYEGWRQISPALTDFCLNCNWQIQLCLKSSDSHIHFSISGNLPVCKNSKSRLPLSQWCVQETPHNCPGPAWIQTTAVMKTNLAIISFPLSHHNND